MNVEERFYARVRAGEELLGRPELIVESCNRVEARGRLVASRNRFLKRRVGEERLIEIAETLRPSTRKLLLDPPLAFAWVPFDQLLELDLAVFDATMGGSITAMKTFGSEIAKYDIPIVFEMLLRLGSPRLLVGKADFVLRSYLRPTGITIEESRDGYVVGKMRGAPLPYYICAMGICGWMRTGIELAGGKNATVVHVNCRHHGDPECRFETSWR